MGSVFIFSFGALAAFALLTTPSQTRANAGPYDLISANCAIETEKAFKEAQSEGLKRGRSPTAEDRMSPKVISFLHTLEELCVLGDLDRSIQGKSSEICAPKEPYLECSYRLAKGHLSLARFIGAQTVLWYKYLSKQALTASDPDALALQTQIKIAQSLDQLDLRKSVILNLTTTTAKQKAQLDSLKLQEEASAAEMLTVTRAQIEKTTTRIENSLARRPSGTGVSPDPNLAWKKSSIAWLRAWVKRAESRKIKF